MKRLLLLIFLFGLSLLLLNQLTFLKKARYLIEDQLVIPIKQSLFPTNDDCRQSLKVLSLNEQIRKLKQENLILRQQLGAIPEKANLWPVKVIWQTEHELTLDYPYSHKENLLGHPVVLGEVYLGQVVRQSERVLIVQTPVNSHFSANGETEDRVNGQIKGQYNTQVVFEASTDKPLSKNNRIYYVNNQKGWRFLLGKISRVEQNNRLPQKQAIIDYLPSSTKLQTVLVLI